MSTSLPEAFLAFKSRPFPEVMVTGDPALDDLLLDFHAELAEFDGHVAGMVDRVAGAGSPPDLKQELVMDESLKRRAQELKSHLSVGHESQLGAYLDYLEAIERLICIAKRD